MNKDKPNKYLNTKEYVKNIKKENRKKSIKKNKTLLITLGFILFIVILLVVISRSFYFSIDSIHEVNMSKTIKYGDRVYVDKNYGSIDRGEVYKFKKDGKVYYDRCIGLGGDVIKVENDKVYINGILFSENYVSSKIKGKVNFEVTVPEGQYFMLGDNRTNSFDSRYWVDKFVKKDDIIGRVTKIVYMFKKDKKIEYY